MTLPRSHAQSRRRSALRQTSWLAVLPMLAAIPGAALAHSFDERYDLPAPLPYFVAGAAAVVALSFVIAAVFSRRKVGSLERRPQHGRAIAFGPLPVLLRGGILLVRALSLGLFFLVIASALFGSGDPLMNLAPTLIWIVWWVGLSLLVACVGNVWPVLDPWLTLFDAVDALARCMGWRGGIVLGLAFPRALGAWPAVALLLLWSWLELVFPLATAPERVAFAALAWSALTLAGMVCFGRAAWQRNADVFALYFDVLGRFAPLAPHPEGRGLVVRAPGEGLTVMRDSGAADIGFVIAMLSTVLFDGLRGGQAWGPVEAAFARSLPALADTNAYAAGTAGLVGLWLVFLVAYWAACVAAAGLLGGAAGGAGGIARRYVWTLVPIAVGYNLAHNFSGLLVQGQNVIPLLSDPFGWHWDLFGTAQRYPDIGIVDARTTWYVAVAAIVAGHVSAVWLAHRVALRDLREPRRAALACVPLTVLMVAYTAVSLSVIAEPMVRFLPEPAQAAFMAFGIAGFKSGDGWKAAPGARLRE